MNEQNKKRCAWVIRVRSGETLGDRKPQEEQEEEGLTAQADMQNVTGPRVEMK